MNAAHETHAERLAERSGQTRPASNSPKLSEALSPETVAKMKKVVDDFLNSCRLSKDERKQILGCYEIYADESQPELTRWIHGAFILITIRAILERNGLKA
jgi:hypothetical protein